MADNSQGADLNTRMRLSTSRSDGSVLRTMITFTIMMVSLPILSYFVSKYVMDEIFHMTSGYLYAAGFAVLAVHAVLALFVYVAWNEDAPSKDVKAD